MRCSRYSVILLILFMLVGCAHKTQPTINIEKEETTKEINMKLYINEKEIPVIWENNAAIDELKQQVFQDHITVEMHKYSNNEQVGSLGNSYTTNDTYITTHNGDIVLYCGNQIVVFYDSNSWSYTRLGKMDLSNEQVIDLLSKEDVILILKKD